MGSHRNYQHAEIPHSHPGPPLEGEGDFAWLNNVANQEFSKDREFRWLSERKVGESGVLHNRAIITALQVGLLVLGREVRHGARD